MAIARHRRRQTTPTSTATRHAVRYGTVLGFSAYRRLGYIVVFTYTQVKTTPRRNRGIGSLLVRGALVKTYDGRGGRCGRCARSSRAYIERHRVYA